MVGGEVQRETPTSMQRSACPRPEPGWHGCAQRCAASPYLLGALREGLGADPLGRLEELLTAAHPDLPAHLAPDGGRYACSRCRVQLCVDAQRLQVRLSSLLAP